MSALQKLQDWYGSQCNGDWEHVGGVQIGTLDNPGWSVTIHLEGTELEAKKFERVSYGVGQAAVDASDDWMECRVEEKKFRGHGGPFKLEEILQTFFQWSGEPKALDPARLAPLDGP